MIACTFSLNGKPLSELKCDSAGYPAFSGLNQHVNKREDVCLAGEGAIPPGTYYIVDRQSGGALGGIRDWWSDKDIWFALYADDGSPDDTMFCEKVKRGNFRLHPKGPLGISQGCITLEHRKDFDLLRAALLATPTGTIPGTSIKAYGTVVVS